MPAFLEIKEMIKILLQQDPANRLSAEELLKKYQHKAFIQSLENMLDSRNEFEFKSLMKSLFDVRKKGLSQLDQIHFNEFWNNNYGAYITTQNSCNDLTK